MATNEIHRMLVVQDAYSESQKALKFAAALADGETDVTVLDVQPPLSEFWHSMIDSELDEQPADHRLKTLRELVRGIEFECEAIQCEVAKGRAALEVVNRVVKGEHQIVIKESHHKVADYLFGSLDFRLVRNCPAPLMLLHPESRPYPQRILVAINPEADDQELELNRDILGCATYLAEAFHCRLGVVAAFQEYRQMFGHVADAEFLDRIEQREKRHRKESREKLVRLIQNNSKLIEPEYVFVESGRPSDVILSVVDDFKPDLLVIGSVARQGISGLLIGNTAERVLRSIDCSVLTVKPRGFRSPLAPERAVNPASTPELTNGDQSDLIFV